jgi:hypothetical protein
MKPITLLIAVFAYVVTGTPGEYRLHAQAPVVGAMKPITTT